MAKRKLPKTTDPTTDKPTAEPIEPVLEPPAAPGQSEATKRIPPDPFDIASDYVAGVHLLESRRYRQMQIRFDDKPSPAVIEAVKAEDFRWNGRDKVWTKQFYQDTAMQTRIDAERLFKQVSGMIRQEKGVESRTV
jgi:hypothetical protein